MFRVNRILLYAGLACTVLALAPAAAAATDARGAAVWAAARTPPGYVIKTVSNISLPNNTTETGRVTCPKSKVVLSGGGYIASSSVMTGINSSYPKNNRTWVVDANNFSGATTTFNVYAVCAEQPMGYVQLESSPIDNSAGQQTSATMGCGTGDVILGGGAISGFNITSVVMTSSYPNSSASWTAAVSNFSESGSVFGVVVICASASAFLSYAIPSTSASDPAGTQKGIIQACTAPAVVLGGGNQSSNTTNLRISIKTTQPFPASGTSWKSGENNDTGFGTTLTSYAICAT
jgi:hypothetical protein